MTEIDALTEDVNRQVREAFARLPWHHPVGRVQWVHIDRVQANDYNPNAVAAQEMKLLHTSISEDGYTQPVVAVVEPRVDIVLPCLHKSSVPLNIAEYLTRALWGTPQGSLMAKEQSLHLVEIEPLSEGDGEFRSVSQKEMEDLNYSNGYGVSGEDLEEFTDSKDSVLLTSGTLPESETSSMFFEFVCPTCESSDRERKKSWHISPLPIPATIEARGLKVSWSFFETTISSRPQNSPEFSDEATTPFGSSDENSNSQFRSIVTVLPNSIAVIVDGYHRYTTMRRYQDIYDTTGGYLPVVVIDKPIADRIASTVRHNRARGKHSVQGMGTLVFQMLSEGEDDATICNKLGLEPEELARLKHITGYSKLYADINYSQVVMAKGQIEAKSEYKSQHSDEIVPKF